MFKLPCASYRFNPLFFLPSILLTTCLARIVGFCWYNRPNQIYNDCLKQSLKRISVFYYLFIISEIAIFNKWMSNSEWVERLNCFSEGQRKTLEQSRAAKRYCWIWRRVWNFNSSLNLFSKWYATRGCS